jgi:hypothetical protein
VGWHPATRDIAAAILRIARPRVIDECIHESEMPAAIRAARAEMGASEFESFMRPDEIRIRDRIRALKGTTP